MTIQSSWKTSWLDTVAPDEPNKFERRLEWDALTEDDLHAALNRAPACFDEDVACYQEALQDALKALKDAWDLPLLPVDNNFKRPFVDIWWPIRCHSAESLRQAFTAANAGLKDDVFDQLADALLDRLCALGDQVLWKPSMRSAHPAQSCLRILALTGMDQGHQFVNATSGSSNLIAVMA